MRARRAITVTATTIVAGIAAYASYSHMRELALHHGQTPSVSALLPISVDGMLIVATMAMREDRDEGHPVRPWARSAFLLGVVASVAANVLAAQPTLTARIVSAWPAVALLLVVEILTSKRKRVTASAQAPAAPVVSHAEPVVVAPRPRVTPTVPDASETPSVTRQRSAQKRVTPKSLTAADRVMEAHLANPAATRAELAKAARVSESTVTRYRPKTAPDASPSEGLPAETLPVDGLAEPLSDASETRVNGTRQTDLLDSLATA